jgi:hypothetical protein
MTAGFAIYEDVLTTSEANHLLASLGDEYKRAGRRNLFKRAEIQKLALDSRLISIAGDFLAGQPVPYKAILFDKSIDSNWLVVWHQDRVLPLKNHFTDPEWGPWTVKNGVHFAQAPTWAMQRVVALRVHLDDSTESNGPLRLIPGSHTLGVLEQAKVVELAAQLSPVTCTVKAGGVIAMRPLLIHASSKAVTSAARRVIHIEYAENLKLANNIELALS